VPRGKYRYTTVTIGGNGVYAKTKHPKEAWEFVKFMASEKVLRGDAHSGNGLASLKSVSQAVVKSHPGEPPDNDYAFIESIKYIKPAFTSPKVEIYAIMGREGGLLEKAFMGLQTPEEVCKEIAKKANAILAK